MYYIYAFTQIAIRDYHMEYKFTYIIKLTIFKKTIQKIGPPNLIRIQYLIQFDYNIRGLRWNLSSLRSEIWTRARLFDIIRIDMLFIYVTQVSKIDESCNYIKSIDYTAQIVQNIIYFMVMYTTWQLGM